MQPTDHKALEVPAGQDGVSAWYRLLQANPHSISAHVRIGELEAVAGKTSLARAHYRKAKSLAEHRELAEGEAADLRRAAVALAELEQRTYEERERKLRQRGFAPEQWSPRVRHALEIDAGRRKYYRQEPTDFELPGLRAVQFFDPRMFQWAQSIEAAAPTIRDELTRQLQRGEDDFRAYIQGYSVAADANTVLLGKKDWSILALCENGWVAPNAVAKFPRTWEALKQAPTPAIYGWGPTIVFSMLKAGAHIPAHTGMFNTRLICHLPLIVPSGCRFRVGNEVREWKEGQLLIFDDTIEHEAWNDGSEDRVVLIFDIWRPGLTQQEKEELTALFHA